MIDNDWQDNAASFFETVLPVFLSAICLLLQFVPVYIGIFNNIRPDLGLAAIYFWMLNRADLFDLKSIVFLGVLDGVISSSIFGLGLFAYLLMYVLMINLRKYINGRPFMIVWYGFMALSLVVLLSKWLIATVYHGQLLPLLPLMFSYFQGAAIYPLLSMVLALVQNIFMQDDEL